MLLFNTYLISFNNENIIFGLYFYYYTEGFSGIFLGLKPPLKIKGKFPKQSTLIISKSF